MCAGNMTQSEERVQSGAICELLGEAHLKRELNSGPHSETQGQGCTVWSSACFKPKTYPTSGIFICDNNNRHVLKTVLVLLVIVAMQAGFGSREDCDFSFLTESSALCECFYGEIFCTWRLSRVLQSYVKQMICFKMATDICLFVKANYISCWF